MFSCSSVLFGKTGGCGFLNWMFQVRWQNRIVRFAKQGCPVLADRTYASLDSIVVNLLSYASHNTCSHAH
jgi:hypothetical protein